MFGIEKSAERLYDFLILFRIFSVWPIIKTCLKEVFTHFPKRCSSFESQHIICVPSGLGFKYFIVEI